VGTSSDIEVDVRIITATNEDLEKAIGEGRFREDLYHRLNEFMIKVPALTRLCGRYFCLRGSFQGGGEQGA